VLLRALDFQAVADRRIEGGIRDARLRARLRDARAGDLQVVVLRDRLLDQRLQRRVAEHIPPGQIGQGRALDRRDLTAELIGRDGGRARVVRADRTAGEQHTDDDDDPASLTYFQSGAPSVAAPAAGPPGPVGSCPGAGPGVVARLHRWLT